MSYIDTDDFAERFIELIHKTHPTLPVVQAYQNVAQPVNILEGENLMVFDTERIIKIGTDYVSGVDEDTNAIIFSGDRLVRVNIELFSPQALSVMSNLRDIWETYSYRQIQRELGFMEERQDVPPINSTRKHSNQKFVISSRYLTNFAMGVSYTAGGNSVGEIDNGTVTGVADTGTQDRTILTTFSK